MTTWLEHVNRWKDCQRCPLGQQRDNIVLARAGVVGGPYKGGNLPVDVLVIGEAPGQSEDPLGLPFVGPAGDLMQAIVERALPAGTTYAMTNLVACFPREAKARGDNEPELSEIKACRPRLQEFIALARPRLIVAVGRLATGFMPDHDAYGKVHGAAVVDVDHPAYILARLPKAQKQSAIDKCIVQILCAWEDVVQ